MGGGEEVGSWEENIREKKSFLRREVARSFREIVVP